MYISIHNQAPADQALMFYINGKALSAEQHNKRLKRFNTFKEIFYITVIGIVVVLRAWLFYAYRI